MSGNRYLQFSIKTLLAVTAIVALGLGTWSWWAERSRLQRENWRLMRENDSLKMQSFEEHQAHLAASHMAKTAMELRDEADEEIKRLNRIIRETERMERNAALPNSSAPTQNPPKQ